MCQTKMNLETKMTKKESVKEILEVIKHCGDYTDRDCSDCDYRLYGHCNNQKQCEAEALYNAGYRKIEVFEAENQRLLEVNRQLNADYNRSLERLKSDCRQIGELNAEVKELKAELNARLTCGFVKTAQKQAQIEVLNEAKKISHCDNFFPDGKWHRYVFIDDIDKLLEELNK
nr:MAG TPA: hypothetical protein [Caudoviricetes sp.]